jgi:hypothetical protein
MQRLIDPNLLAAASELHFSEKGFCGSTLLLDMSDWTLLTCPGCAKGTMSRQNKIKEVIWIELSFSLGS